MEAGGITDIGLARENNEDYFLIDEDAGLFVVADGLGGHAGGEVASKLACDSLADIFKKYLKDTREEDLIPAIDKAIKQLDSAVFEASNFSPQLSEMGTTLVFAFFKIPDSLYIANVGDSRAYLWRSKTLSLLSHDHSVVNDLIEQGQILPEQARGHPLRNLVTQFIGLGKLSGGYQKKITLKEKDIIILCSDGLWDALADKAIKKLISFEKSAQQLCHDLIDASKAAGGDDNITVLALKVSKVKKR